ncbi:hypothetical protein AYR61_01445 [Secundilactobacillus paracollinoides]|uniref:Cell envelope-related transcriptional attenuator domain-containing protein n=2 Tax=Secundilactobacillus paracollinoides TaxID=240427 RepID=A0A1B2IV71_9LACO|nr:hypothetical protein AYR61_01445 [Secundilactobacillus paracollinoides]ANZ65937.1 hypothetical protein AYR63_01465 [Secundilactobacillus paracollinoides]
MKLLKNVKFLAIVAVLVIGVGFAWFKLGVQPTQAASTKVSGHEPLNVLVIGTTDNGKTQSSMTLVSLNPKKQETLLTQIPNNEETTIRGYKNYALMPLSTAFDAGGATTAVQTVRDLMHVSVDGAVVTTQKTATNLAKVGALNVLKDNTSTSFSTRQLKTITSDYLAATRTVKTQRLTGAKRVANGQTLSLATPTDLTHVQKAISATLK